MHCTNCGAVLQPGVANCTNCGAPVAQAPAASQGAASYDPTIVVPPQQGPANPYGNVQPAPNPYGSVPSVPTSYGNASYTPPPPPVGQPLQPNYTYPQAGYPVGVPPVAPGIYGMPPQQPKKRSRVGLFIAIGVGVLLLACVAIVLLIPRTTATPTGKGGTTPATTPATTPTSNTPSGQNIVASASAIILNAKTTSAVDTNYAPTKPTTTFKTGDTVYITFDIQSGDNDGYIETKWYADGKVFDNKIFHHTHGNTVAYSSIPYTTATPKGAGELYWCTKADCSDGQLAQIVNFTVGATGLVPTQPNVATAATVLQDADRRLF